MTFVTNTKSSCQWNLNERSDYLSRCRDSDDWSVQDLIFQTLDKQWGPHTIDRFASYYNSKCKRYNSRWWVPGTEGVNSLDQYWGSPEVNWAVPRLIPNVLEKFQNDNAVGTVVIPEWPAATFWPILISEGLRKRIKDTFVLPRYNSISKGLGNNGIFVKESLSFRMIAI